MTHSREVTGFSLTIKSDTTPIEDLPKEAVAEMTFNKAIEASAGMVMTEFDVTEEMVCGWLMNAAEVVKERLESKSKE